MGAYPWGSTAPPERERPTSPTPAAYTDGALVFRDAGTLPGRTRARTTTRRSSAPTADAERRRDRPRPPRPAARHGAARTATRTPPERVRRRPVRQGHRRPAALPVDAARRAARDACGSRVAGSDKGVAPARARARRGAATTPAARWPPRSRAREQLGALHAALAARRPRARSRASTGASRTSPTSPSAPTDLQIRYVDQGKALPAAAGHACERARWVGAGYPDYPWLFATDARVHGVRRASRSGQFEAIKDHVRALRDVSDDRSTATPARWRTRSSPTARSTSAPTSDPGNTDETVEVPERRRAGLALDRRRRASATSSTTSRSATCATSTRSSTPTATAGPRAWATSSARAWARRSSTTPSTTIRGLYDLADMARSKGDDATERWARRKADDLRARFEAAWWMPESASTPTRSDEPNDAASSRSTGSASTPMEAELTVAAAPCPAWRRSSTATTALAGARDAVLQRHAAVQPRPVPHRLRRRADRRGRADDLLAEHRDPGRRRGQLRPPRREQQQRYTDANVEPMFGEPATAASPTSSRARCRRSSRRRTSTRHDEHRPLLDLPRDVHAGLGPLRHGVAGRPPAARRAPGPRPRRARGRAAAAGRPAPIAGSNIRLGTGALKAVQAAQDGARYTTTVDTGSRAVRDAASRRDAAARARRSSRSRSTARRSAGSSARPTAASRSRPRPATAGTRSS